MIYRALALLAIGLVAWTMTQAGGGADLTPAVRSAFMLGFVLLSAHLVGAMGARLKLPRITGYLVTGILFGPYLVGLLSTETLDGMSVFVDLANAFIGLAAGSELHLAVLRKRARSVLLLIGCTVAAVFAGVTGTAVALSDLLPGPTGVHGVQVIAVGALLGIIAAARSPSSAIAVIAETRARGPFSETILGVSMAMDLLILPLFHVAVSLTRVALSPDTGLNLAVFGTVAVEIVGSVALGVALGGIVSVYMRRGGPRLAIVLLGVCFVVYKSTGALAAHFETAYDLHVHLEPLLVCAATGFIARNFSGRGEDLAEAMESVGLPVYVVFFTMAGARLDLGAVQSYWALALVLATARVLMIVIGSQAATRLAGDPPTFRRHCWKGFVTQAGLSIALADRVGAAFPGWGVALGSLLVAVIAFNQLVGPVLFKQALERVGETRNARRAALAARAAARRTAPEE